MTKLLYFEDSNLQKCTAKVLSVSTSMFDIEKEDVPARVDIILDQTCFYPRGGGQDWDMGAITNGYSTAEIIEVKLDENGTVHHITDESYNIKVGDEVTCIIDADRRLLNSRLHSAGHLIDMAVKRIGLNWRPTKGQHYPGLSAVEYSGEFKPEDAMVLRDEIEELSNDLQDKLVSRAELMPLEKLADVCGTVPNNLPNNKPCRVVFYGDEYAVPCGGTHVTRLKEVGRITISKIKQKHGTIRVKYEIQ